MHTTNKASREARGLLRHMLIANTARKPFRAKLHLAAAREWASIIIGRGCEPKTKGETK